MNLEETLRKMKKNEKTFYPLVEGMKRRADKGLLEGITSDDIDYYINKIEKETVVTEDHININQEIFELNEAIEKFDYMDLDSWSEEILEDAIFLKILDKLEENYILLEDESDAGKKVAGITTGVVGGTLAAGAAYHHGVKPLYKHVLKPAGLGIAKGFKWLANHHRNLRATKLAAMAAAPAKTAALSTLGGAGLALGAVGIGALIHHLRKKRKQNMVSESLFSNQFISDLNEILNETPKNIIENLQSNEELTIFFENYNIIENQILDEAVTFIDNAGNLKTMSTPDYVKDQHEYHTETQIAKYEKKKKKKDYKLISEKIDIDNIKKLSEMSLEDILNEEWDS